MPSLPGGRARTDEPPAGAQLDNSELHRGSITIELLVFKRAINVPCLYLLTKATFFWGRAITHRRLSVAYPFPLARIGMPLAHDRGAA